MVIYKKNKIDMKRLYEWEEFEDNKVTVYVVLNWFYEGDSYLVNSYLDCFLTLEDAVLCANKNNTFYSFSSNRLIKTYKKKKEIYMPGEKLPKDDDGGWGSPGYIQIIKKEF